MLPLGRWVLLLPPLLLPVIVPSSGFFGWLTRSASPTVPQEATPELRPPPHVPFEMTTADERFLAGAQLQLSALDSCHHKVIAEVRSSCAELTEEELAKLGVSLFNCQASAEGRKTYLCTEDMTIAECTSPMDPDTWNAYHVISNRARAVCYATRQLQFKRQAEHTVNALVSTAASQLEAMQLLKTGQDELKSLTSEALQKVASSQQELLAQQAELQGGQQQMEDAIHSNLGQLAQEKALIASGHQQVAQLIEGITRRMENVSHHLDHQDMDLQEGHQTILKDLNQMQAQAQEVFSKMETNLGLFLAYQNQTALYYEELMRKLQRMNESLGLVLRTMEGMQKNVEGQLQHIQRFINWAGFSLSSVYTCVLHGSYFLLAALILSFLQIPGFPRAVLLVLVVANALSELNHAVSLGFKSLTSLLGLSVAGNWLLGCLCSRVQRGRREKPRVASLVFPGKQEERCAQKGEQKAARSRTLVTSTPDRETDVDLLSGALEKLEEVSHSSDGLDLGRESLVLGENYFPEGNGTPLYGNWKPHLNTSPCPMNPCHPAAPPSIKQEDTLQSLRHPHHLGLPFRTLCDSRASSLNQSLGSDLSACSMTLRPFCQGITRTGQQCRKKVSPGNTFCHIHASGQSSYIG